MHENTDASGPYCMPEPDGLTLCVVGVFGGAATTPKADGWRRFRRKTKVSDGPEPAVGPRSPTVYDWFVLGPR